MSESDQYSEGSRVKWKWDCRYGDGVVKSRFEEETTRTINGSELEGDF